MLGWLWKSPRCHWIKRELCTRTHLRRGTQGAVKNRFWMETRCPNALYNSAGGILQSCGLPTTSKQSGKIYWLVNNSHTLAKRCYLKFHTSVKCIGRGGPLGQMQVKDTESSWWLPRTGVPLLTHLQHSPPFISLTPTPGFGGFTWPMLQQEKRSFWEINKWRSTAHCLERDRFHWA